jgi:predicted membrane-bound mannosyltransferase
VARHARIFLLALIALAALLRFATLDAKSLWEDEAVTAFLVRMDVVSMLSALPYTESSPPLFFVLSLGWTTLFGTGEVGLRSLSALVGLAVVPVGFLLGRELVSERTGLVTAGLIAVNPLLIWYSQETRAYSLLVLTSALALLFFNRAVRHNRARDLALWTIAACLSLATHYFALFLVVPEMLWLLYKRGPQQRVLAALGMTTAVGIALLPLALMQRANGSARWITKIDLISRVVPVPAIFLVGFESPLPLLAAGAAAMLAGYGIWLLVRRSDRAEREGALLAAAIGAAGAVLPLALSLVGIDHLNYKNVIGAVVPLTIPVAAGFATPRAGRYGIAAAGCLGALSVAVVVGTAWEPKYHREAWREAAQALGPPLPTRAVVATPYHGRNPLEYYLPRVRLLGRAGAWVSEIDVLALRRRPLGAIATPRLPPATASPTPPRREYRLVERRRTKYFILFRYRAAHSSRVQLGELRGMAVDTTRPAVLVQGMRRTPTTGLWWTHPYTGREGG